MTQFNFPPAETAEAHSMALDDLAFAKLALYGAVPGDHGQRAEETRLRSPERLTTIALCAFLIVLAYGFLIQTI